MVNKKIQLDFTEEGLREKIEVVQGDTGRVLICNIIGVDMTNVSARFYAVKNSGKEIYNNCTVSQNTVTIELTEQTLAEVGIVKCQLDLRKGDQKVQSFTFDIDVTASLMAQSEYLSSDEYKVVDDLADKVEKNENKIAELDDKKANKDDYGSPLQAKTVAEMTDKKKVYVYVGTETGYINGNWYTWKETAWVSGGVYNSAAIQTDKTLTQSDKAADSAIVGKQIGSLKESLGNVNEEISGLKGIGSGLTTEQKRYIVALFKSAVYSKNMSDMVTALEDSFNTIPATGIKLSPTTIKFSGIGDTQKITATLTPDTATSSILWESDNTDVVTVKDGIATAVNDGIATITATSGSATAKCSVNVNTKELYSVSNKVCNADFYEATGLKFGSNSANGCTKSWTIFINCSTIADKHVMGLNASSPQGLLLATNGANRMFTYWCSNNLCILTQHKDGAKNLNWCFAITYDSNSNTATLFEFVDNELKTYVLQPSSGTISNPKYEGELYIGGSTNASYVGTIYEVQITMQKLSNAEIESKLKKGVY